jgi:hypothetical protein
MKIWMFIAILIAVLIAAIVFIQRAGVQDCTSDSDCVPKTCCHAKECVSQAKAPECKDIFCSQECAPGTMDCGQGKCICQKNKCAVRINP